MHTRQILRDGKEVFLTRREFHLLCYLVHHAGWIRTKEQILEAIWEDALEVGHHAVETLIHQLRRKIEPDPSNPTYIYTVIGHGYRFQKSEPKKI